MSLSIKASWTTSRCLLRDATYMQRSQSTECHSLCKQIFDHSTLLAISCINADEHQKAPSLTPLQEDTWPHRAACCEVHNAVSCPHAHPCPQVHQNAFAYQHINLKSQTTSCLSQNLSAGFDVRFTELPNIVTWTNTSGALVQRARYFLLRLLSRIDIASHPRSVHIIMITVWRALPNLVGLWVSVYKHASSKQKLLMRRVKILMDVFAHV